MFSTLKGKKIAIFAHYYRDGGALRAAAEKESPNMRVNDNIHGVWAWCRRYITFPLVVIVAYVVFLVFFNENSYAHSADLQAEIDSLKAEIRENRDTMEYYRALNASLDTDPATLERIVRENYHFQRINEDVYVIE